MSIWQDFSHLNGNILAVIDTETTGPFAGYHDIIEVCVMVLGNDLKPAKKIMPFSMELQPRRIENIDLEALRIQGKEYHEVVREKFCKNRQRVVKIATNGCDADVAADLFGAWFDKLNLAPFKRLYPIACNWPFDREFLRDWLGVKGFEYYFDPRFRDVMSMSLYDNDIANWRQEQFQYPKNNLQYLCSVLKIERGKSHTAFDDVLATAEVYRRLVTRSEIRILPKQIKDDVVDAVHGLLSLYPQEDIQTVLDGLKEPE